MPNVGAREVPASPETGLFDRAAEDDALFQAMLRILERVVGTSSGALGRGSTFDRLRSNGEKKFRGISGVAPNVAEYWLKATERIMDDLDCISEQKIKGAVSLLQDEAYQWWLTGNKIVGEYEADSLRLSHYSRGIVATEYEHSVRFDDGLRDELRVLIALQRELDFAVLVEKPKITNDVKRSECQNREKDRGRFKRDSEPSSSSRRLKRKVKLGRVSDVGLRLGHVSDVGLRNIKLRIVLRGLLRCKLQGQGFAQLVRGVQQPPRDRG
ncbi:uncharacterized protein LOC128041060 [Gossypium raimondii]|uniref:uncharacterized protein LOC128041060 n=1 Tax=Gossypium raimondii TaxID=29730 RepID=UPI00227D0597|nr:uncharacterized protein LOC128041060 [Gossypium raimondii]